MRLFTGSYFRFVNSAFLLLSVCFGNFIHYLFSLILHFSFFRFNIFARVLLNVECPKYNCMPFHIQFVCSLHQSRFELLSFSFQLLCFSNHNLDRIIFRPLPRHIFSFRVPTALLFNLTAPFRCTIAIVSLVDV